MNDNIDKFSILFDNMTEGVALHRYVYNDKKEIVDYIIEDVNKSYEDILKMKKSDIIGKRATEIYSVSEAPYLKEYSNLKSEQKNQFEVYFQPLEKYFFISVSPWGDDGFATIFFDITERKKTEQELKEKNDNLETLNRLMINRELKMVELKEELKKNDNKK